MAIMGLGKGVFMASASVIDALLITLGIDSSGVKSGMAQAENTIAASAKNIMNNILAPLAAAFAIGSAFKEYISNAAAAGLLAETIGESAEDISAWAGAVDRAGGDAAAFEGTILSLNDKMLEFTTTGTSSIAPALAQLGISARNAGGDIKSSIDILEDLSKIAGTMDNKRFTSLAQSLGIDNGTIMLLSKGSASVSELIERQKLLGVMNRQDAETAMLMKNAFKDLIQVLRSISTIIMQFVVPPLTFLTNKLVDFVLYIREHEVFLRAVIAGIAAVLTGILLPALIKIGAAMLANPLTWIFIGIATAVLGVSLLIEDLFVYMQGGQSALAGFWSMFGSGQQISEKLSKIWVKIKDIFDKFLSTAIKNLKLLFKMIGSIVEIVLTFASHLGYIADIIKSIFTFDGQGLKDAFEGFLVSGGKIVDIFIRIIGYIKEAALNFLDFLGVKEPLMQFFNWLDNIASAVFGKISGFVSGIADGFKSFGSGIVNFFTGDNKPSPAHALPADAINNSGKTVSSTTSVSVGAITVTSPNADPKAVAVEIPAAMYNKYKNMAAAANTGVNY